MLLGLARGSGTRSLAGMAVRGGRLLRPLLGLRRHDHRACCAELGLTPWADPHNADPAFTPGAGAAAACCPSWRTELGPGIAEALARTAELCRADADLLDALAAEAVDPAGRDLRLRGPGRAASAVAAPRAAAWLLARGAVEVSAQHLAVVEPLVIAWHGQDRSSCPTRLSGGPAVRPTGS